MTGQIALKRIRILQILVLINLTLSLYNYIGIMGAQCRDRPVKEPNLLIFTGQKFADMAKQDSPTGSRHQVTRITLGVLEAFLALNAFGGGIYGMAGAEGVPLELLEGSPFDSYFIPSLFLFISVGGGFALAAVATFAGWRTSRTFSFAAVTIVFAWLAVQLAIIGYISWMQPVTAVMALMILLLAMKYRPPIRAKLGENYDERHINT